MTICNCAYYTDFLKHTHTHEHTHTLHACTYDDYGPSSTPSIHAYTRYTHFPKITHTHTQAPTMTTIHPAQQARLNAPHAPPAHTRTNSSLQYVNPARQASHIRIVLGDLCAICARTSMRVVWASMLLGALRQMTFIAR